MTRFAVDLAELDAVIADLRSFESTLRGRLVELDATVDELHGAWSGAAADAQKDAHARWKEGAEEMHRALVEMREAADRAHANYSAAADANARMWRQTR